MRAASLALLLLLVSSNLRADPPADGKDVKSDPALRQLIEDLGSSSFTQREQATRDIEAMGPAALPQLHKTAKGNDEEVNVRVSRLITLLEEKAMTASLLASQRVHLKVKDVSVQEAVVKLREISGLKLDLTGDLTGLSAKFTLDTGDVTVWEALQQLCEKGGLGEQVAVPSKTPPPPPMTRTPYGMQQPPVPSRAIVLQKSALPLPPTSLGGSIRIRALPAGSAGQPAAGEVRVVLEAVAEQRLQGFGIVDALCFDKSVDDQGQNLELLAEMPLIPSQPNNMNRLMVINGNVVANGGMGATPQRTLVLRFKQGEKAGTTMKELSGKVLLQAQSPLEPLAVIKDVRKAAGRTVRSKDGGAMRIDAVEELDNKGLRLKVTLESPAEAGVMPQNAFGNNVIILNGNFNGNINGVQFMNGMPINNAPVNYPKLVDARGKKLVATVNSSRPEAKGNGQVARQATLTYPSAGEGILDLVLEGQRTILFAVPISLKDIPLN